MPELPEVEIVKRSLKNKANYKKIKKIIIKNRNLRFKIQKNFKKILEGRTIINVSRFSKRLHGLYVGAAPIFKRPDLEKTNTETKSFQE